MKDAFLDLKKQGMTKLVLDLRNNGGGLLQEAVKIMNIFVDQGTTIVTTKGKIKEQNNTFRTPVAVTDKEIPVVVLVNEMSASASEIVSGSFQDLTTVTAPTTARTPSLGRLRTNAAITWNTRRP